MSKSNIRLRTNVVCIRSDAPSELPSIRWDDGWTDARVTDAVFYWDLLELSRRYPNSLNSARVKVETITEKQRDQRDAFWKIGAHGRTLWPTDFGTFNSIQWSSRVRVVQPPEPNSIGELSPPGSKDPNARRILEKHREPEPKTTPELPVVPLDPVIELELDTVPPNALPVQEPAEPVADETTSEIPKPPYPASEEIPPQESNYSEHDSLEWSDDRDLEQESVLNAPAEACLLVQAPPGSGKTYTLIQKAIRLYSSGEVESANAITVLSFTRAAVAEITKRIREAVQNQSAGDDLRYVNVRTFDSFAGRLLSLIPENRPAARGNYEHSIQSLTALLQSSTLPQAIRDTISEIRVLLVDEVQDLTGMRGRMVLELIKLVRANSGGVVLFGDFAQAIYDFTNKKLKHNQRLSTNTFWQQVRDKVSPTIVELKKDYRSKNDQIRELRRNARLAMGTGFEPDGSALGKLLFEHRNDHILGSISDLTNCPTAFLARNVEDVTRMLVWCQQQGILATPAGRDARGQIPGWIARLVFGFAGKVMSRETLRNRWNAKIGNVGAVSFDEAFKRFELAGVMRETSLDLDKLHRAVRRLDPHLLEKANASSSLTVSTIHKSKGLEFERVILFMGQESWAGNSEEIRIRYVAATRARTEFHVMMSPTTVNDFKRYASSSWKLARVFDVNLTRLHLTGEDDIDEDSVFGDWKIEDSVDLATRQQLLWDAACYPSENKMFLDCSNDQYYFTVSKSANPSSRLPVCLLNEELLSDISKIREKKKLLPTAVSPDLELVTLAAETDDEARARMGWACLATAPRLTGWIQFEPFQGDDQ